MRFIQGHIGGINSTKAYESRIKGGKKRCSSCGKKQKVKEFRKYRDPKRRLCSHCRTCRRKQSNAFYQRNPEAYRTRARKYQTRLRAELRSRIFRIKEMYGCRAPKCDERDVCCLDFHHLYKKDRDVTHCHSVGAFERELVKCAVLCANCHRKAHAGKIVITKKMLCHAYDAREAHVRGPRARSATASRGN